MCIECVDFARAYVWWMNLVFNIFGFVMIIGAIVAYFVSDIGKYVSTDIVVGTGALGLFIVVLSTLALCGSKKINHDNRCTLKVYISLLCILILSQVALVVIAMYKESHLEEFLLTQWNNLDSEDRQAFMEKIDCGASKDKENGVDYCGVALDSVSCFADCYNTIKAEFSSVTNILSIVGICVLAYELLLVFFACCVVLEEPKQVVIEQNQDRVIHV